MDWSSPNVNTDFLEKYWKKTTENFLKTPWGIEDLALLENDKLSLHFYQRNLVSFDSYLKAGVYKSNAAAKTEFDLLVKSIALLLKASDIIIIEDSYYDYAFAADNCFTVEMIRQKLKTINLPFYEIDLNS